MKKKTSRHTGSKNLKSLSLEMRIHVILFVSLIASAFGAPASPEGSKPRSTSPQPYSVERNEAAGILSLRTPYYTVEHDLKRGGAVSRITLRHGRAENLLVRPVETRVRDENGAVLTDLEDRAPRVSHRHSRLNEIVEVASLLADSEGRASGLRLKTTYEYRWGYIRIHKEIFLPEGGRRLREVCPLSTVLSSSLNHYGYREGITEEEGAPEFSFGSNIWGRLRPGHHGDPPLETSYVPRSMIFIDPGIEGLEWCVGSDLSAWEWRLAGRRGGGRCVFEPSRNPAGLALSVSPLWTKTEAVLLEGVLAFDFYLAFPVLEGHAQRPWVHTSFNRNRGNWVSTEEIRRWAEQGYQTVHCHNDGDYYDDGLFWRDGSYPPYPDMDRFDRVLEDCRRFGIRTATYFSNKELHPSTEEFKDHGQEWGRMDRKGHLRHNFFRGQSEFGAQMCLRSGWLDFLKFSIDRVLNNHPLDGVYFDWNVALLCSNPLHEGKRAGEQARGHWDMDELLELMEWTRDRVGPRGIIIVHNTTVPMFATENFADFVVATEWGYGKWTDRAPAPADLPLEWSLAGARPRGVISYGMIDENAPRRLHKVFALEAFLGGVAPWPASPETFELLALLKPLGDIESYRFADWRNRAVALSDPACASAIYSREGEAYIFLANLDQAPREVTCVLHPELLPYPINRPSAASLFSVGSSSAINWGSPIASALDINRLIGKGLKIKVPGNDAVLIQLK